MIKKYVIPITIIRYKGLNQWIADNPCTDKDRAVLDKYSELIFKHYSNLKYDKKIKINLVIYQVLFWSWVKIVENEVEYAKA